MIETCLPLVSAPSQALPAGACDCHCHVFGPYDAFPLAAQRTYQPPEAPARVYLEMLDQVGMARGVLVQATAHGLDHRAMLHALKVGGPRLRGVAVADAHTPRHTLRAWRDAGVRGLRFSRLLDDAGRSRFKNAVDVGELPAMLPAMRELGLHAQLWIGIEQLPELAPLIRSAGIAFVVDHLARLAPQQGTESPAFRLLCSLVAEGHVYVKLTPYRASHRPLPYEDMRPFHERLVATRPDRLLWGSDWPHINMTEAMPEPGRLLDILHEWTPDQRVLEAILVGNPALLYGFEPAAFAATA